MIVVEHDIVINTGPITAIELIFIGLLHLIDGILVLRNWLHKSLLNNKIGEIRLDNDWVLLLLLKREVAFSPFDRAVVTPIGSKSAHGEPVHILMVILLHFLPLQLRFRHLQFLLLLLIIIMALRFSGHFGGLMLHNFILLIVLAAQLISHSVENK